MYAIICKHNLSVIAGVMLTVSFINSIFYTINMRKLCVSCYGIYNARQIQTCKLCEIRVLEVIVYFLICIVCLIVQSWVKLCFFFGSFSDDCDNNNIFYMYSKVHIIGSYILSRACISKLFINVHNIWHIMIE